MVRRSPRPVALALAPALALALAACGDDDDTADPGPTTSTAPAEATTTSPAAPEDDTTTSTTAAPEPAGNVVEVEVAGGQPVGGARDARVPLGEEVTVVVTADGPDEVHVHGYDLEAPVGPDAPAAITFVADIPGQFEVELHDSGALILNLVVS